MTARVILFPQRAPFAVRIEREGPAWLVLCRDHGWLHGDRRAAIADANRIARGFGAAVNLSTIPQNSRKRMQPRAVQTWLHYPHRKLNLKRKTKMMSSEDEFDLLYGSKYLSAADLKGQRPRRTIGKVETTELKDTKDGSTKKRRIIYFEGEDKAMVCNKTNATRLAMAFGKSAADWVKGRVELYAEMTNIGKEGIYLTPLRSTKAPPVAPPPSPDDDMDDEVPFNL